MQDWRPIGPIRDRTGQDQRIARSPACRENGLHTVRATAADWVRESLQLLKPSNLSRLRLVASAWGLGVQKRAFPSLQRCLSAL
jgi:hypothetical protein